MILERDPAAHDMINKAFPEKVLMFTCITGQYDQLHEFETPYRKIAFTDRQLFSSTWEVQQIDPTPKVFRQVKILPHKFLPPHDRSIWLDGHLQPQDLTVLERSGFWLMRHPTRDCVYQEAQECLQLKKDNPRTIAEQIERYRLEGYPAHNGLCATGVLIRDNNPEYYHLLEMWWDQVRKGSVRDQLSFNYCAWRMGFEFETFPFLWKIKKWKHTKGRHLRRYRS